MSETHTEVSPIESVEVLDDDLAIVTVRMFDGTSTEYTASRHSAAAKVRFWKTQALPGTPPTRHSKTGRQVVDSEQAGGEPTKKVVRAK